MKSGVWGDLESTYPPLTGPAWSSFMTGKSPAQHGVFEFFRREEGSYRQLVNSHQDLDGKSLWRILSEAGKHVGVMGVPLTYPPEPVNGFLITGLLTPAGSRDFTYPNSLLSELESHLGDYRVRHDEKYRHSDPEPFLREQYEILDNNIEAALYLMREKPWDFFMLHLLGTDRMQHEFWHLLDTSHPRHDAVERRRLGNVILDYYRALDAQIGRLIEALDDEVVILIMSDHGFGPVYRFVNFNTWLLREGLLRLKKEPRTWFRYLLFRLGVNYSTVANWILRLGMGRQAVAAGRARREKFQRRFFLSLDDVDWSRSQVYSMGNFGQLYVNLKGREPQGIVSSGAEYDRVLSDLAERLQAMAVPDTGKPVIEQTFCREEIYAGPYAEQSADLMFTTQGMKYKAMGLSDFSSPRVFDPVYGTTGHHRMNGVMIWQGAGAVKGGEQFEGAFIHDLAPTILYAMGLPIPGTMDGRVLTEVFTPAFQKQRAIVYVEAPDSVPRNSDLAYSDREQAEMREMLRALGYVT
jgi:predicted AlkP superfamily phosphohydrolase/phosphomutase